MGLMYWDRDGDGDGVTLTHTHYTTITPCRGYYVVCYCCLQTSFPPSSTSFTMAHYIVTRTGSGSTYELFYCLHNKYLHWYAPLQKEDCLLYIHSNKKINRGTTTEKQNITSEYFADWVQSRISDEGIDLTMQLKERGNGAFLPNPAFIYFEVFIHH